MKLDYKPIAKLLVVCFLAFCSEITISADKESRVIFDEEFSWLTPDQADETLGRIKRAGFNVFVPVVWHGRGVTWNSTVPYKEPRWEETGNTNEDPLEYLIHKAHEMNIEVHPWFTVVLRQRDIYQQYYDEGTPSKAFNIHMPEFRSWIISLMMEVVEKYDVDGVNLDYIRSMGVCDSRYCARDYRRRYRRNLLKDLEVYSVNTEARERITTWNRNAITDIVHTFYEQAKAIKPYLVISVDVHSLGIIDIQGADSIGWANNGYIDQIYEMHYLDRINEQLFGQAKKVIEDPKMLSVLVANFEQSKSDRSKVWPRKAITVRRLIEKAKLLGRKSEVVALYEYRFLTEEQIFHFQSGPFKADAIPVWSFRE